MTFWVYMLHCRGGYFYTGHTDDLDRWMGEHESGTVEGFVSDHWPAKLVWSQECASRIEALEAERRVKGWSRVKKMALIRGDWDEISRLAKGKDKASTSSARTELGASSTLKPVRPELVEACPERLQGSRRGLPLFRHPQSKSSNPLTLHAQILCNDPSITFRYYLTGNIDALKIPPPSEPLRQDNLWQTTCFEAFLKLSDQTDYIEYNFSPSNEWAAYHFSHYRDDMSHLATNPIIKVTHESDGLILEAEVGLPFDLAQGALANLTAVIEEKDGTKSYWALAHPDGPPDFHDPACFVLKLGAPDAA